MHWIQAKKSLEPDQPWITVEIVDIRDDGHFDIEGPDLELTLWHHDIRRLRQLPRFSGSVEWRPRFHVLHLVLDGDINVATIDPPAPCAPPTRRRPD